VARECSFAEALHCSWLVKHVFSHSSTSAKQKTEFEALDIDRAGPNAGHMEGSSWAYDELSGMWNSDRLLPSMGVEFEGFGVAIHKPNDHVKRPTNRTGMQCNRFESAIFSTLLYCISNDRAERTCQCGPGSEIFGFYLDVERARGQCLVWEMRP
jgi:hypothetical protein